MIFAAGWAFPPRPGETVLCQAGLPIGARLIGADFDASRDVLRLHFEHESFDEVIEGATAPHQRVVFGQRTEGLT